MPTRSHVTIDHDEIRRWAEERGACPTEVKGTGIIRLDFPGFSGEGRLEPVGWDEFFERFEESNLALVYQDTTASGQKSNFNKFVSRESVDLRRQDAKAAPPRRQRKAAASAKRATSTRAAAKRATSKRAASKRATSKRAASKRATPTPQRVTGVVKKEGADLRALRTSTAGRTVRLDRGSKRGATASRSGAGKSTARTRRSTSRKSRK